MLFLYAGKHYVGQKKKERKKKQKKKIYTCGLILR